MFAKYNFDVIRKFPFTYVCFSHQTQVLSQRPQTHFPFFQRVQLFNAYAHAEMCRAGIQVVDVFPLTSSYAKGTYDHVHYPAHVMDPLEKTLISDAEENDVTSADWYDRLVHQHPRQYCVKWTNS